MPERPVLLRDSRELLEAIGQPLGAQFEDLKKRVSAGDLTLYAYGVLALLTGSLSGVVTTASHVAAVGVPAAVRDINKVLDRFESDRS